MNMKLSNMEQVQADGQDPLSRILPKVREAAEPLRLTVEGDGGADENTEMVVMSVETYDNFLRDIFIWSKLREAEIEEEYDDTTYTHEEVFAALRASIGGDSVA